MTPLLAANFVTTLNTSSPNIEPGQEFIVTIAVSNAVRLEALEGSLQFDTSRMSLVASEFVFNGHNIAIGSRLVARFNTVRNGSFVVAQVRFRARSGFSIGESTTIAFTSIMGSDGTTDFASTNASTTVTMVAPRSSNNFLASLSLSTGNIPFDRNRTSYSVDVDHAISNITIGATLEDNNATITGLGTFPLNIYENEFTLTVTAENGSRRTISITIRRKDAQGNPSFRSGSTDLTSLTVSACQLHFVNAIDIYQCEVRNDINVTTIDIVPSETTQRIQAPREINLKPGDNSIDIIVTASNETVRRITITITRRTDVFFVPLHDALSTLTRITTPILGVQLDSTTMVPATLLNEALRLGKQLVVTYREASLLITPIALADNDVFIAFRHASDEDLARFNYARGQFVGLNAPLPPFLAGSWWIDATLQAFQLHVYAIDDPTTPLRIASTHGVIEVSDLTQALFITPATPVSPQPLTLILVAIAAMIGLVVGAGIMGFILLKGKQISTLRR